MRRVALSMVIAAALGAAGCGSKSDEEQVKEVVGDYIDLAADGNGAEACKKLSPEAERAFTAQANISCEQGIEQISKTLTDDQRKKAKEIDEFDVKIDGDKATVTYDKVSGSGRNTASLEKRDDEWLIASA